MNILTVYPHGLVTFARQRDYVMPYMARSGWTDAQDKVACRILGTDPASFYEDLSTMGLSKDSNSHKVPQTRATPRGLLGISTYGRRLVRWGCDFLQREYSRARLSFITLTLPTLLSCVKSSEWSEICRRFYQSLKRELQRFDLPGEFVGVTEVQEARQEKYGGVPLHLHVVVVGRHKRGTWVIGKERIRDMWMNAVMNVVANAEKYDWSASTRIESVRKSASGYLGKYMSKGLKAVEKLRESGLQEFIPASWYSCSLSIRNLYKQSIRKRSGNHIPSVFDRVLMCVPELFRASGFVEIDGYGDGKIKVAWWGELREGITGEAFLALFDL